MICLWVVNSLPALTISQRSLRRWGMLPFVYTFHEISTGSCCSAVTLKEELMTSLCNMTIWNCFVFSIRVESQQKSWRIPSLPPLRSFFPQLMLNHFKHCFLTWSNAVVVSGFVSGEGQDWTLRGLKWDQLLYREVQSQAGWFVSSLFNSSDWAEKWWCENQFSKIRSRLQYFV